MDIGNYDPMVAGDAFDADRWERSPLCGPDQGDCVEINFGRPGLVAIRDSKLANSPVLVFSTAEWETCTRGLREPR
ncbi:DUF397 domain-containing protein [Amycolatopsis sp. OK19-0408]|uniref:DUF397 domain-containing protein n=1 Tax=Amycolatopsis iheyensis TaxID=2945988 RepID=A0A9X2SN28_9PSEU|nr:DUF397 domain-containing protein [Amycolatopsis iheyensis]MCR6488467.1 DUF397 domain-containing protein [Amycolatopsis iheyensis]